MNTINQGTYKPLGIIKSNLIPLTILLTFGLILFACNENHNPVSESTLTESFSLPAASTIGVTEDPVTIQDFTITFNGISYDSEDNTIFSYTVARSSDARGYNFLFFETPTCANYVSSSPSGTQTVVEDTQGIKWTSSIGKGQSQDFSVTYSGEQPLGMVEATIQGTGSGDIETKPIPGPCKGVYTISGFIYVDENDNKKKDTGEGGIGNVTVDIFQNEESLANKKTSANGAFSFDIYTGNTSTDFTLKVVRESTSNSFLFDNFSPTTNPPKLGVDVSDAIDGTVSDNDLGFKAQTEKIIKDFENETTKLQTEKPRFWADESKFADKGRKTVFTKTQLLGFLQKIDNNYLDLYNFKFGIEDNDRLNKAQAILTVKGKSTEIEQLRAELLAAMLNVASGGGAVEKACNVLAEEGAGNECVQLDDFNDLILKTGIAALISLEIGANSALMMNSTTHETTTFTITSQSLSSGNLLRSFNGGGGGVGN